VVDLNAATDSDLDGLPGVGPVLAGRIVAWRTQHGRFSRVDELGEVAGIGPKLLERLRPLVSV
jgi:competence protein ComEA